MPLVSIYCQKAESVEGYGECGPHAGLMNVTLRFEKLCIILNWRKKDGFLLFFFIQNSGAEFKFQSLYMSKKTTLASIHEHFGRGYRSVFLNLGGEFFVNSIFQQKYKIDIFKQILPQKRYFFKCRRRTKYLGIYQSLPLPPKPVETTRDYDDIPKA